MGNLLSVGDPIVPRCRLMTYLNIQQLLNSTVSSGEGGDLEGPPCPGLMLMSADLAPPGPEDALPPSSDKAEY